ncbi:MAG: hypothetical protein ACKO2C_09300 [Actinomycetes bacterium]
MAVSTEVCRGGRVLHTISNRRTRIALTAGADDVGPDGAPSPELLADLEAAGCLGSTAPDGGTGDPDAPWHSRLARFVATLDLPIARADRTVRRLHRAGMHRVFRPRAIAAQVALALAGIVAVALAWCRGPAIALHVPASRVPIVLAIGLVAVAVHEFAHALVIVHHGRRVDSIGFRLHLATPAFYVESVDALHMTRRQRIVQAAAGPWAEWLVTSVAAVLLLVVPGGTIGSVLSRFAFLNTFNVVSNLLPFVGLDGALILADVLHIPDLPQRSRGAVGRLIAALAHRDRPKPGAWGYAAYAVANAAAAIGLLVLSGWMWVNLFGDSVHGLWSAGPVGVAFLAVSACVLARPGLIVVGPRILETYDTVHRIAHDRRFRRSTGWRIAATRALCERSHAVAALSVAELGVLAGRLERVRAWHRPAPGAALVEVPVGAHRRIRVALPPGALP